MNNNRRIPRIVLLINALLLVFIPLLIEYFWEFIVSNIVLLPLTVIALIGLCLGTAYLIYNYDNTYLDE